MGIWGQPSKYKIRNSLGLGVRGLGSGEAQRKVVLRSAAGGLGTSNKRRTANPATAGPVAQL